MQNLYIDRIHCYSDGLDPDIYDLLRLFFQEQAVGAEAIDQLWKSGMDQCEGIQSMIASQRITGTGDAGHSNVRAQRQRPFNRIYGFIRGQNSPAYPGALFAFIKPPAAEFALNVAGRTDREMDPAKFKMCFAVKARVGLD